MCELLFLDKKQTKALFEKSKELNVSVTTAITLIASLAIKDSFLQKGGESNPTPGFITALAMNARPKLGIPDYIDGAYNAFAILIFKLLPSIKETAQQIQKTITHYTSWSTFFMGQWFLSKKQETQTKSNLSFIVSSVGKFKSKDIKIKNMFMAGSSSEACMSFYSVTLDESMCISIVCNERFHSRSDLALYANNTKLAISDYLQSAE